MSEQDSFRMDLIEVLAQCLIVEVVADWPVEGVSLGREQVHVTRRIGQGGRPLRIPGVCEAHPVEVDPQR